MSHYTYLAIAFRKVYFFRIAFSLIISVLLLSEVSAQSGMVFRDYSGDGIRQSGEPLVSGIIVNAYNTNGTLCSSTTTSGATAPNYTLPTTCTGAIRVEFQIPTTVCVDNKLDFTGLNGSAYGSSVQFTVAGASNINFAINHPTDYNLGKAKTEVFIPCYVNGDPLAGGGSGSSGSLEWFVGFPYTNADTLTPPNLKVNGTILGATWGVAYSKQAKKIFTTAFLKRHVGLGTLGTGGIYLLTPTANSFMVAPFYDMDANGHNTRGVSASSPTFGEGSSFTINTAGTTATYTGATDTLSGMPQGFGVVGTNTERGLSSNPLLPSNDPATFDQVGKVGLGGITLSDDGKYLFVVNLFRKRLYRLELDNPYNPTAVVAVTSIALPSVAVTNGVLRPFGVKYYRGEVYVGAVTTAENSGVNLVNGATDMYAYVFRLSNPATATSMDGSPVLSYPLNYLKGYTLNGAATQWYPWTKSTSTGTFGPNFGRYPSPILSDIDFTERGDLVMAFTDRSGHQWGFQNYRNLKGTALTEFITGGDILIAGRDCNSNTYVLENNGMVNTIDGQVLNGGVANNQGPGGGEFFSGEFILTQHQETSQGAVAVLPGINETMLTIMDPLRFDSGGLKHLSSTNGAEIAGTAYELYFSPKGSPKTFGKANGLGDFAFDSPLMPIEIGNRVWQDTNNDGIQDAGEPALAGVTVQLYDATKTNLIASAITNANGNYYFSSASGTDSSFVKYGLNLAYLTNYQLVFTQGADNVFLSQKPNVGTNDLIDTDADTNGIISFTTGDVGQSNHSFDVAYTVTPCNAITVGSVVVNQATCVAGVVNNDAEILLSGIVGGTKYSFGTDTTSFSYASATSFAGSNINFQNLLNPSNPTRYYVRMYDTFNSCAKTLSVDLLPKVCCSLVAKVSSIVCNNMQTSDPADDRYSFVVNVSVSNGTGGGSWGAVGLGTGLYDVDVSFTQKYLISEGTKNITISSSDNQCATDITLTPPVACSVCPVNCVYSITVKKN
ncbi:MAG: SdrD B-like domain-containing protein [Spirosomataceae bacterium]